MRSGVHKWFHVSSVTQTISSNLSRAVVLINHKRKVVQTLQQSSQKSHKTFLLNILILFVDTPLDDFNFYTPRKNVIILNFNALLIALTNFKIAQPNVFLLQNVSFYHFTSLRY